jgi:hypothetical protein
LAAARRSAASVSVPAVASNIRYLSSFATAAPAEFRGGADNRQPGPTLVEKLSAYVGRHRFRSSTPPGAATGLLPSSASRRNAETYEAELGASALLYTEENCRLSILSASPAGGPHVLMNMPDYGVRNARL